MIFRSRDRKMRAGSAALLLVNYVLEARSACLRRISVLLSKLSKLSKLLFREERQLCAEYSSLLPGTPPYPVLHPPYTLPGTPVHHAGHCVRHGLRGPDARRRASVLWALSLIIAWVGGSKPVNVRTVVRKEREARVRARASSREE